ncbi:MAG: MFS transporter [Fimbriimonadaceae bacterium]|nr:MFS transporter [Fimbriimonadaceae bacterium]
MTGDDLRAKLTSPHKGATLAIVAAALGYFVDVYDLWLYSVLRVKSLNGLGITDDAQVKALGEMLLNWQMGGFLVGALAFGLMADRKGRLTVLFGSILLYSAANIANGFVQDVTWYAVCRFVAGVGLAGELGAGIALVSELVPKDKRGWATTIVATIGVAGSVAAALFGKNFEWRTGYWVGGGMGLILLLIRLGVYESGMFEGVLKNSNVRRGDFLSIFRRAESTSRYLATIFVGAPVWFFAAMFMTFSKELQDALGVVPPHSAPDIVMIGAIGLTFGDVIFGALSQIWRSRRKAIGAALALMTLSVAAIFFFGHSPAAFYWLMLAAGIAAGYWAVFVTTAGETFGTNLRGTVAISAPCFVRGMVIPMTLVRGQLTPSLGILGATATVGLIMLAMAVWSVWRLPETYGRDLDFIEGGEPVPSIA